MIYHQHALCYRAFLAPRPLRLGLPERFASLPIHPVHEDLPECGCGRCNLTHCITLRPPCPTWVTIATMQKIDDEEQRKAQAHGQMGSVGHLQQTNCFLLHILAAASGYTFLHISCPKRCFPGVMARWFLNQAYSPNPDCPWQCSYISPKEGLYGALCPLDYATIILNFLPGIWQGEIRELTLNLVWHKRHLCVYCHGGMQAYPISLPMPMPCCQLCGDRPADHHPCCCPHSNHHTSLWATGRFWCAEKMYGGDMELLLQQILMASEQLKGPRAPDDLDTLYRSGHTLLPPQEFP